MLLTGYSGQAYLGMGDQYLFTSVAAVAIGGASILGGTGHYIGTIAGALVLTILAGLLPALGLSTGAVMIVNGAVILLDCYVRQRGPFVERSSIYRAEDPVLSEVECIVDAGAELGEGTLWDPTANVLWWLDIWGSRIHRHDPVTARNDVWECPEYPGCLGIREAGGLVMSMVSGFHFFDPQTGEFFPIADPEADNSDTRFNDGKVDRQGRFWSGTLFEPVEERPVEFVGALYRMDADLSVHRVVGGIGCSNGLAFSPDSRVMYFADSHAGLVWRYDFDAIDRRGRQSKDLHRHVRFRWPARWRNGRRRWLLLAHDTTDGEGLSVRS